VLRHVHGYTNREIATALGVPERTVASRLIAARNSLKKLLGTDFQTEVRTSAPLEVPSDI